MAGSWRPRLGRQLEDVGSEFNICIKNQRSEVRKNDPNGVMSEDRGGDRKGKSDLMKGRGQR